MEFDAGILVGELPFDGNWGWILCRGCSRDFGFVDHPRFLASERCVAPAMVVESQPIRHELRGFAHRLVAPKSQFLVFDASPEALDKHVVHPATFAVHPDLNTVPFDRLYPFRTRKLRALICIKIPWACGPSAQTPFGEL